MGEANESTWLDQIAGHIGEYARMNPGYSTGALAESLKQNFLLCAEDAVRLAALAQKETAGARLGLAAIELNLTFNCNLTCAYCFIHDKDPRERMTLATAQKAVGLLVNRAQFPVLNVTFMGGEPLLEFDLIKKIVPYALDTAARRGLGVTWAITTNGTMVDEEILKFFAQHKISMLISMDGGPESHDRYRRTRGGEGTFRKIAGLIPLIKGYQPWLGARMTVSTETVDNMVEDFKQLLQLGFNQFIIAPAQGARCWSQEEIERYGLNLVQILKEYHELKRRGVPVFIEEFEKDENAYTGWGCRAGRTSLSVAPNGDVSPCSKLLGLFEKDGKWIIGNVNSEIDEARLEPFLNPISRQPEKCGGCSRKCSGGCYAVNYEQTGDHFVASEENCLFWVVCQETKKLSKMMKLGGTSRPGCRCPG